METLPPLGPIPAKSSVATAAAIGIVAYALMDVVHEAGGHWVSTLFFPRVRVLAIATIGLTTHGWFSPWIAVSGTAANLVAGAVLLWLSARRRHYFFWLAGTINLLEVGYLVYSGVTGLGDWAVVVRGRPVVRIAMIVIGAFAYCAVVRMASRLVAVERRAIITSYVAGSVMMIVASAMNPLPYAIVHSGLPAGFGLTAGLLFVTGKSEPLPHSNRWIAAATFIAATFIGVLGPGIRVAK